MGCVFVRHGVWALAIAAAVGMGPAASWAQTFPAKTVRYVVPFGAGGSPDLVARILTERLARQWGQQVIVDNRVGVAGVLGTAFVAKSPPDGYTLVQCNVASSGIAVSLFQKMPYDQLRDIAAVTRIGMTPNIIFVHPSMPVKTLIVACTIENALATVAIVLLLSPKLPAMSAKLLGSTTSRASK